jgi:hypothetical protein
MSINDITGDVIKSRVSTQEFRNNYDNIFRKNKGYYLFIDDVRNPKGAWLHDENVSLETASSIPNGSWEIVRNYKEFVAIIQNRGIPSVVSFDMDLLPEHLEYFGKALAEGYYDIHQVKHTGYHCALYLLGCCISKDVAFPTYHIHSANPFGRELIKELIENAKQGKH